MALIHEVSAYAKTLTDRTKDPDGVLEAFMLYVCSVMVYNRMSDIEIHRIFNDGLGRAEDLRASGQLSAAHAARGPVKQ